MINFFFSYSTIFPPKKIVIDKEKQFFCPHCSHVSPHYLEHLQVEILFWYFLTLNCYFTGPEVMYRSQSA